MHSRVTKRPIKIKHTASRSRADHNRHVVHGCEAETIMGTRNDHGSRVAKRPIKIRNEKGTNRT